MTKTEFITTQPAYLIRAFVRGQRDAEARKGQQVPYADKAKAEAYEQGYRYGKERLKR